ncbi:MAG TPA: phosphatidate cytidylyltransferase, partial [Anaerolineaceae bacterium]
SLAMFTGGTLFALAVVGIFILSRVFTLTIAQAAGTIFLLSAAATLVESLPFNDLDNLTVPAVTVILGSWLFHS